MTTATQSIIENREKELNERAFLAYTESFFNRWAPKDEYDKSRFHAELMNIVRLTYTDAQAPLLKHITHLSEAYAKPPFIVT